MNLLGNTMVVLAALSMACFGIGILVSPIIVFYLLWDGPMVIVCSILYVFGLGCLMANGEDIKKQVL